MEFNDIVKGTLYWPYFSTKNKLSNKYSVTIGNLDRNIAEQMKAAGAKISNKEGQGLSVIVKSDTPILVVDSNLDTLSATQLSKVGNGTIAEFNVRVAPSKWSNSIQACNGVKILKLVEFIGKAPKSFEKGEGFRVGEVNDFESGTIDD